MKLLNALFVFAFALMISAPSNAQTPVSKEIANTYFENCRAQSDPRISKETQDMLCACTAAQMTTSFTLEDMQNAQRQDALGRAAANKLIINIYAPCIEYPAKDYHYKSCISNPKTKLLGGSAKQICECTSNKLASHLKVNAKAMFADILKRTPNILDPMQALYDDPSFQKTLQSQLLGCIGR